MDGNGRWAKKRGLPRYFGHREGAKTFQKIVSHCRDLKIPYVTFYAFSTENWKRPQEEVDEIMKIFRNYLDEVRKHIEEKVRVVFIGDKSVFDEEFRSKMIALEEDSRDFTNMTLILAINYGGRDELVHVARMIAEQCKNGSLLPENINENIINEHLYTKDIPDVDFIIRPSGEQRLSNFLTWQSVYAELYFTNILWPDFTPKDMDDALIDYLSRGRRFGGV